MTLPVPHHVESTLSETTDRAAVGGRRSEAARGLGGIGTQLGNLSKGEWTDEPVAKGSFLC